MTPLKLRLKGFIGIRDGMGRDELTLDLESVKGALVAITGPNGTGKTTILDNLHPYRIMPSRASSYSVNAFSYWGQVHSGEAMKELVWSHAGVEYKSILILRSTGKTQKSEAYLQVWNESNWQPYSAGMLLSDGKNGTYDTCIENILGTPELYFTAAFSAQGRKLLSGYTNAEIKSLLSSLLGLGHIEDLAVSANEKRLTAERKLQGIRDGGAEYECVQGKLTINDLSLVGLRANQDDFYAKRKTQRETEYRANETLATARSQEAQAAQSEQRAVGLRQQIAALNAQEATDLTEARATRDNAATALVNARKRHEDELTRLQQQLRNQEQESAGQARLVARIAEVNKAITDLAQFEKDLTALDQSLIACETEGERFKDAPAKVSELKGHVHGLAIEAKGLDTQLEALNRRSALVDRVPCAGTELQNTCELLADARTAKAQIADLEEQRTKKIAARAIVESSLVAAEVQADRHAELQAGWRDIKTARSKLLTAMDPIRSVAAMKASVDQAEASLARIGETIIATKAAITQADAAAASEIQDLEAASKAAAGKPLAVQDRYKAQRDPIEKDLASLPTAASATTAVADAEKALKDAQANLDDIEKALDATKAQIAKLEAEKAQLDALAEKAASHEATVTAAADDLAHWNTLCKALGPNGVIALVIDDAGPSLAVLINDLLRASYGPRFSVRIDTQHQNTDGTFREDFDIVVFDGEHGSSKSLTDCSPGQQIVLNDAICSGVAVHMSQQSSRDYECRMSDESDGALDAERKLQYMAMKREVLKLTGMQREFFISHSTATWELADAVIDLGQYIVTKSIAVAEAA